MLYYPPGLGWAGLGWTSRDCSISQGMGPVATDRFRKCRGTGTQVVEAGSSFLFFFDWGV